MLRLKYRSYLEKIHSLQKHLTLNGIFIETYGYSKSICYHARFPAFILYSFQYF